MSYTISTSEEWSSIGKEANGGVNNNEATNNLHLLASAGLEDLGKYICLLFCLLFVYFFFTFSLLFIYFLFTFYLLFIYFLAKEDSGECGLEDGDSNTSTPRKRKRSSDDNNTNNTNGKMQTDVVRVPGLSQDLQQQITKFDSSEFDVSYYNYYIKGQFM